jgi:DNA-binding XRE family transcriptional regulator/DNA-binding Lrp family transcriptional regulator
MMIETTTRSALRNKDDASSFSEHKDDDVQVMDTIKQTKVSPVAAGDGLDNLVHRTTIKSLEKPKQHHPTPPRHEMSGPSSSLSWSLENPKQHQTTPPARHEMSGSSSSLPWTTGEATLARNPADTLPSDQSTNRISTSDPLLGGSPVSKLRVSSKLETIETSILVPLQPRNKLVRDPLEQEQALFEQRLCEDGLGVAVRKINQNGKSNLRYVKCVYRDELEISGRSNSNRSVGSRSVGSWRSRSKTGSDTARRVLVWGKKKDVQIPLENFTSVCKGKVTERSGRNPSPPNRVLSLLTTDPNHPSLDIEAPTRLDRDKFARAFARFLDVPLKAQPTAATAVATTEPTAATPPLAVSVAVPTNSGSTSLAPSTEEVQVEVPPKMSQSSESTRLKPVVAGAWPPPLAPATSARDTSAGNKTPTDWPPSDPSSARDRDSSAEPVVSVVPRGSDSPSEDGSEMSSITGHGYDQEIVEELHQALNDLRTELTESRAEAARAVKVAEHAIQSAEKNSSQDWQNTVTHKAAEAAAIAQKRSAEAMAKQRLAEERLKGERRTAAFWRRQAEVAEEEAGALQTRAAAAEVQRSAMEEELHSQRRMSSSHLESFKKRFVSTEVHQQEALEAALERNRALELELDSTRRELTARKIQQENLENTSENPRLRKKLNLLGRKKKGADVSDSKLLLAEDAVSSSSATMEVSATGQVDGLSLEQILKLHAETVAMRKQFELLQKATADQLMALPGDSQRWIEQISEALGASQSEAVHLRERLAIEGVSRRKLLYEVQDLRGVVRVYCRVRPMSRGALTKSARLISQPSQETLLLHRERFAVNQDNLGPMSFDFDRVFDPETRQQDVYSEIEDVCLGVLDGYKICILAYGQSGTGKTRTLLGDVKHTVISPAGKDSKVQIENHGIQLQALKQLFAVAEHRSDRYKDTVSMTIVEVHNERLCDLMAGTTAAEERGRIITAESKSLSRKKSQRIGDDDASSSKLTKLEIRSDLHGDTAVHGVLSVEVESLEDVCRIWDECLEGRETRLAEQGLDAAEYEASSHVIATINVVSANIATGHGSVGKIQFVDLAGADLVPRRASKQASTSSSLSSTPDLLLSGVGNTTEWKFKNRSLDTLNEVVTARSQFVRKVPYRNSTLTHLLRDSLEADTKVLLLACVSSDPKDMQETASTLRFASRMRRVTIGKATKHTVSPP